jgi:UDP:flavonoid glycosyltransferase YjiC (YdhE family)
MKNILFLPGSMGYGHFAECLALANIFHGKTDCRIIFGLADVSSNMLKGTPYVKEKIYDLTAEMMNTNSDYNANLMKGPLRFISLINDNHYIKKCIEDEVKLIKKYDINLVIYNTKWVGNIAANICKIPSVAILQVALFLQKEVLEKIIPDKTVLKNMQVILKEFLLKINTQRKANNVSERLDIFECFLADYNYVSTIEKFGIISAENKSRLSFYGPFLRTPNGKSADDPVVRQLVDDKKTIFVTMGGGGKVRDILAVISDALSEIPDIQAVITTGKSGIIENVKETPPNIILTEFVNGIEMTKRADVVITHGGYNTLMEILTSGKPSLILPYQPEQMANASHAAESDAALVLPPDAISKDSIKEKLNTLLTDPKYSQGARDMSDEINSYPGVSGCVDDIIMKLGWNKRSSDETL